MRLVPERARTRRRTSGLLGLALLAAVGAALELQAQQQLERSVIAGGSGEAGGGQFYVRGTVGQIDAEPLQPATGGVFAVTGGFWAGTDWARVPEPPIFNDGFESPALP